jgi:hypothetical protein
MYFNPHLDSQPAQSPSSSPTNHWSYFNQTKIPKVPNRMLSQSTPKWT